MNHLIISEVETGKTSFLFAEIKRQQKNYSKIIVFDSVTEHKNKSLIIKLKNEFQNIHIVGRINEEKIKSPNKLLSKCDIMTLPIFEKISQIEDKIICFDLSFYLERGHEALEKDDNLKLYNRFRKLYRYSSFQILYSILSLDNAGILNNILVVMDEIELPNSDNIFELQNTSNFLVAVHPNHYNKNFYLDFIQHHEVPQKLYD